MTDVSVSLRAKRKRGRPRKDSNLSSTLQSPENSTLPKPQLIDKVSNGDTMVGTLVYGVIEGSFDAGYLISIRIGNNHTPLRGVVFLPRKFVPVTASNDMAPQAKMYHRKEVPIPVYDNVTSPHSQAGLQPVQASKQAVLRPVLPPTTQSVNLCPYSPEAMMMRTSSCSNMGGKIAVPKYPNSGGVCKQQFSYVHPTGSLRMVEEDEVMQAFEVSTPSGGSKNNLAGDIISETLSKENGLNQKDQEHGKAVENMTRSAFEIQQDEMICREMEQPDRLQSPTTGPQEIPVVAQSHSITLGETFANTEQLQSASNQYYNVSFHQNLFTDQSQPDQEPKSLAAAQFHPGDFYDRVSKSPNLKLDLAFSVHENKSLTRGSELGPSYSVLNGMRNPNLSFHQALVAGNPLLLPPDLTGEPLDFMMEKPKSPQNCRAPSETGVRFHGEAALSPSASYKLELATPQSALNRRPEMQANSSAGCMTDMDFVLSDSIRPHHHQSGPSEAEPR